MAKPDDTPSMAVFCDFENVALGVRDAKYEKFDIRKVLERLLLKGSIVVKKAYCDWARYREFKAEMHEASFELIEIPHVRQSGKNSADIRMVVDALDLCYTKSHVDTFVIISGDSDFSPLVSKLRENAKTVIGVGVKGSTSDLLTANCDEFIFYDDLVREQRRRGAQSAARRDTVRDGGRENGREGGREGGRDGGRENARGDAGREGGRDPNRDAGRGNGPRGPGRGGEREGGRDPARVALTVVPSTGAAASAAADDEDAPSVGGPWRPFSAERRDTDEGRTDDLATTSEGADADGTQAGDAGTAVEASGEGAAPPARPGRRSRRGRTRAGAADDAAPAGEPIDPSDVVSAADFVGSDAADGADPALAAIDAAPVEAPPLVPGADATPPAEGPKKRAPRRRKTAPAAIADETAPADDAGATAPDAAPPQSASDPMPDTAPGAATGVTEDAQPDDDAAARPRRSEAERRQEAIELAVETVEALLAERGADDKIWGSMVKQTLKRRRPGFAESYYGYRSFNELLEDARDRGLLSLEHDEKSGGYVIRLL
jgi:uncharacterized protein (TIGR00288 family)